MKWGKQLSPVGTKFDPEKNGKMKKWGKEVYTKVIWENRETEIHSWVNN